MIELRLTVSGLKEIQAQIKHIEKQAIDRVRKAIGLSILDVQRTARTSIQRGPKTGRVYFKARNRKRGGLIKHQASAPGEAPASDTGNLAASIVSQQDLSGLSGFVEARAQYAKALEFGKPRVAARPFMRPALKVNREKIVNRIAAAIRRAAYEGARKKR